MIEYRRPSNALSGKERPVRSLSCRDSIRKRRILALIDAALKKMRPSSGRTGVLAFLMRQYCRTSLVFRENSIKRYGNKRRRTLESPDFRVGDYRFQRHEIALMATEFRIPDIVSIDGNRFTAEEILLIALYRLSSPRTLADVGTKFNRDNSAISKALRYFFSFMIKNWLPLVQSNMQFYLSRFPIYASAIYVWNIPVR